MAIIERFQGDSYPITYTYALNGSPVDVRHYALFLYYNEVQPDTSVLLIKLTAVKDDAKNGKVNFYPRSKYCYDVTNSVAYNGLALVGTHEYSIVRELVGYDTDDTGMYVVVNDVFVVYDAQNVEHTGLQRYTQYQEVMTHDTGTLVVNARVGA
jgi:hypothetical protein